MQQITPVVKYLLIFNVILFLLGNVVDTQVLAMYYFESPKFQPFQIVTHFFMHGSFTHILFNMVGLWLFGSLLERRWGGPRFLFYYIICALGAALLHTAVDYYSFAQVKDAIANFTADPSSNGWYVFIKNYGFVLKDGANMDLVDQMADALDAEQVGAVEQAVRYMNEDLMLQMGIPIVGASGALYGLLVAFGLLYPEQSLYLLFFPFPIKAKYLVPALILIDYLLGINPQSWDNIAHFAHLGGAITGVLLILLWRARGREV